MVTLNECLSRSIAAGWLLLWGVKVTQTLIGKRLLYAQGHTAQHSEQHRPGSFAPLTLAQAIALLQNLQCLFPPHKATIVLPAFGRSYLLERESRAKKKIEKMH